MAIRLLLLTVLIAVIAGLSIVFARPLLGLPQASPSGSPARAPVAQTATPSPTRVPAPSPTRTAAPTPTTPRTPTTLCPDVPSGGTAVARLHSLTAIRIGEQPGFDRVVFEFGQEQSRQDDVPRFHIERSSAFSTIAGSPVVVQGTAFWSVRFEGASIADDRGNLVYRGPQDLDPNTALVRDVRLVNDFEAQMTWAIGLARLECPRVTTLRSPLRVVLDFPTGR
jgi:hypothetical protein